MVFQSRFSGVFVSLSCFGGVFSDKGVGHALKISPSYLGGGFCQVSNFLGVWILFWLF